MTEMGLRLAVAAAAIGTVITPAIAQTITERSKPSRVEIMSCEEVLQLRSDRQRWDQMARSVTVTDEGWSLRSRYLGFADRSDKLIEAAQGARTFEARASIGYTIGAAVLVTNVNSDRVKVGKLGFLFRWISEKPMNMEGKRGRCSIERTRQAEANSTEPFAFRFEAPEEIDNQYGLIAYDGRKNILFTATFAVRPGGAAPSGSRQPEAKAAAPESKTSVADENVAALRVAYSTLLLLERCSDQYVSGAPLSVSRDRVARIEKSAAAMGIDVRAAKAKAQQDSKANMDMFDMFEALGAMNYQQRDSLKQFCAVQGMTLLDVSKHFAELDRAAGR